MGGQNSKEYQNLNGLKAPKMAPKFFQKLELEHPKTVKIGRIIGKSIRKYLGKIKHKNPEKSLKVHSKK